jgi:hypothetical protein
MHTTCPAHLIVLLIDHCNNIWGRIKNYEAPNYALFYSLLLLRSFDFEVQILVSFLSLYSQISSTYIHAMD